MQTQPYMIKDKNLMLQSLKGLATKATLLNTLSIQVYMDQAVSPRLKGG